MQVTVRRRVPTDAVRLWSTLADHQGMTRWAPGVEVRLERPGDVDRNGVGAVRKVMMGPLTIREEIIESDPGRRLAYRALSGHPLRDYAGVVTLAPRNGVEGTLVSWQLSTSSDARAARVLLHVNARMFLAALLRVAAATPEVLR